LRSFKYFRPHIHAILPTVLILITTGLAAGQTTGSTDEVPTVSPVMRRIERARALAAVHQLQAAATELENVRASVSTWKTGTTDVHKHYSKRLSRRALRKKTTRFAPISPRPVKH